ncbi:MAG: hypothetical protein WKF88_10065 [Ferruginibacter sp.]
MRLFFLAIMMTLGFFSVSAQQSSDSIAVGTVTIIKDPRIDMLGKKMAEYNEGLAMNVRSGRGYRLMVISTGDRALAMKIRSQLYQYFPNEKQYMSYQLPNIKIKFGNFVERSDAEKMRKLIMDMKLVTNNIYLLPETIEIKPEKKEPSLSEKK